MFSWSTNPMKFLPNVSQWRLVCSPSNAKETRWLPYRAMVEICWKACWSFFNACVTFWWSFSQTLKYHSYICNWLQNTSVIIKLNGIWGLAIAEACYYKVVAYSLGLLTVNHTPGTSFLSRVEYTTLLKTGSLDNAIQNWPSHHGIWAIIPSFTNMVNIRIILGAVLFLFNFSFHSFHSCSIRDYYNQLSSIQLIFYLSPHIQNR